MKLVKEYLGKVSITVEKDYWTSDKSYDRLVIVEVLNVGCYISRKAVPRGAQYDNREYWIRLSKNIVLPPSPEPTEFPIVTEFGDSVDVTIAQKTITDKFTEVNTAINNNQTAIEIGFENIDHRLERIVDESIAGLNNSLDALDTQLTLTNENIAMIQEDILDHLSKIRRIRTDLSDVSDTVSLLRGQVGEMNTSLVGLSNSLTAISKDVWQSEVRHKPIYYIGDRITEQADDSLFISTLNDEIGVQDTGVMVREDFLSSNYIRYIVDHPEEFGDELEVWLSDIIIIQLGSTSETIGTFDGTAQLDLDDPTDYPDTFCGNMSYVIDKLNIAGREENVRPTIFIVAPPRRNNESIKEALVNIQQYTNFILVDPFNPRYDAVITKNITIEGDTKLVLAYEYARDWAKYVARTIKTNI